MAEVQSEGGSRSVLWDANSRTPTRGWLMGAAARERTPTGRVQGVGPCPMEK